MSRYRRINIDGRSLFKTETRRAATDLLPGTLAVIDANDQFAQASTSGGRMYVIDVGHHEGLGIRDAIPEGHSAVGNYIEEGRELALLCVAGAYGKDTAIKLGSDGTCEAASDDTDGVIGYSQDVATLTGPDFIRVRMRVGTAPAPDVTGVTVVPDTASVEEGDTVQLAAIVSPGGAPQGVTWSSSASGTATVDSDGLVTGVAAGTVTITAESTADGTKTGTALITVTSA